MLHLCKLLQDKELGEQMVPRDGLVQNGPKSGNTAFEQNTKLPPFFEGGPSPFGRQVLFHTENRLPACGECA